MRLADILTSARTRAGKTQREAAAALKVSPDTIGNWEAGKTEPRPAELIALAAFYGTRASIWIGGLEAPQDVTAGQEAA